MRRSHSRTAKATRGFSRRLVREDELMPDVLPGGGRLGGSRMRIVQQSVIGTVFL
jgi:hypothetical protein